MHAIASIPGQTILRQGQDNSDIHFIRSGSVHLTYSATLAQAAPAANVPCGGVRHSNDTDLAMYPVLAAAANSGVEAANHRTSSAGRFSSLAFALKLEHACLEAPVVLASR